MRTFLGTLLTLAILGFGGATTYLAINERELVFHPAERAVAAPPAALALRERSVAYPSGDGTTLRAWVVPGTGPDSVGYWMLICHGNYGNIGYGDRPAFYASARDLGLNLLAFDYRGFGESEGSPEEQGLYADA
ncbi:MAG: hypothetical protein H7066_12290, partial [Cytophagaceae bacterium]|nr:hypothetical protein [Gemmatimonadaceae bacterium]